MDSPDAEPFGALRRTFDNLGLRWYIFGAQAAILYGAARLTEDVDITVDAAGRPTSEIVDALEREGFCLRVADAGEFVSRTRVLPMLHEASDMPVDVVLSGPGLEERFFERLQYIEVEGVTVPVASAEDIVTMKILASRPKDLEDALLVLAAGGERLDIGRIEETLAILERALDQSDLMPTLRDLLIRRERMC